MSTSTSQDVIPPPPPPPPSSQTPTQLTPHTVSTIKLPILKKGEYDIWAMKMEHYLAHTDYPIWEVLPPRTAKEIVARERERKARTTLVMTLPEDHLVQFHKMTDEQKKCGMPLNLDLVEMTNPRRCRSSTASSSLSPQNIAFVSENTSSTNEVSTAYSVPNLSGQNTKYEQPSSYSLLANQSSCPQLGSYKIRISKALVTVDGEGVDWTNHSEDELCFDGFTTALDQISESVFMNKKSEIENQPLYDRFVTAEGMHAVPPPMTGNYMPSGPDVEVDDSKFTYGPKQTQPNESETQSSEIDTCESNISAEPSELVSEPVVNESNVKSQPKVWSDAPIIEEYESDSDDECVVIPTKQQETPSFANQQVKTPRENVKNQSTHSQKPKVDKKDLGYGFAVRACFVCGSLNHLIRDCNFHEKRMARKADLNNVNTARTSGTKIFSTARQSVNRQTVLKSTAMKVNTVKHIVNGVRPANVFNKTHSSSTRPFKKTTVLRPKFSNQKFNTAKVNAVSTVGGKRETAVKPSAVDVSRHMTGNKAYLDEFQDFNGAWPVAFGTVIENQLNQKVKTIRSDNGTEFKNKDVIEFCGSKGIKREYSNARTPQQNGVAERKNRTLIEAARTMLADSFLPNTFWAEAVSTACYVLNRVLVTKPHNKTPYELLTGKIPIISYIRPFGCHVTILNTIDHLGKFAGKSDEGFLVGYSLQSKAFRVYNLETKRVEENLHITFKIIKPKENQETYMQVNNIKTDVMREGSKEGRTRLYVMNLHDLKSKKRKLCGQAVKLSGRSLRLGVVADFTNLETVVNVSPIPTSRIHSTHPKALILGDPNSAVQTRSKVNKSSRAHAFFEIQKVWVLVDLPYGKKAIGTKWVYQNKKDERGVVVRNKARMDTEEDTIANSLPNERDKHDFILVQVFVMISSLGSTKKSWCDEFED
ncbi:retrovirus-related pol polyprotein from transposon TNT 1-94 [Tanacetum coccineum]